MRVFGILLVRNEVDVVSVALEHHLALGLTHILVLDNGSTDGTERVLSRFAWAGRVSVLRDAGPFRHAALATLLAREAFARDADWVVPFDADEFWHVPDGDLAARLAASSAGALRVQVTNFVQRQDWRECTAAGLLHMTRRAAQPVGPIEWSESLVDARSIAYVEALHPSKWAVRGGAGVRYSSGCHHVTGIAGAAGELRGVEILHAPLRSLTVLQRKAEQGRRVMAAGFRGRECWHSRRLARLEAEGALEAEWRANSYDAQGWLDVYGVRHALVQDLRLSTAVARWLGALPA